MDIERTSNRQIYFVVRNRPFTFAPKNLPLTPIKMNNNDELIELLKRMHDILHQAYETEQGNVTDNLPAELSTDEAMVLWKRKGMYRDYYQALDQKQSLVFQNKIKELLY
jgi:hypothetical protein